MKSMIMDDHGNALGGYDSLREGISALRKLCILEPEAKDQVALMVFDDEGTPIDTLLYEDVAIEDAS